MNILILPSLYHPHIGGVELVVSNLARQLLTLGHTVEIVTNRYPRSLPAMDVIDGIKVTRLPFALPLTLKSTATWPLRFWQSYCGLNRILRSKRWDVVNLHYPDQCAFFAGLCCPAQNVPIVASIHGSDIELIPNQSGLQRLVTKRLLRKGAAIVANSKSLANSASLLAGTSIEARLVVIGNAINLPQLEIPVGRAAGMPARYILGVGRLIQLKGFDLLTRAFAAVASAHGDVHLVIVGDGVERPALGALAAELGITNRLHFVGRAPQHAIPGYMQHAEFVVIPSRREGFGLVALEAMACQKAVVAMPVGGLPEIVADGHSGLLAAAPTSQALAGSIAALLDRPELATEFGRNGRQLVGSRNTWDQVAQKYLEVFESVLRSRPTLQAEPAKPGGPLPNALSPPA